MAIILIQFPCVEYRDGPRNIRLLVIKTTDAEHFSERSFPYTPLTDLSL